MWYACLYEVSRAYGGPEEGGWYYDTGEPELNGWAYSDAELSCRFFMTREEASEWKIKNLHHIDALNAKMKKEHSEMRFDIRIGVGVPSTFPKVRPHYE